MRKSRVLTGYEFEPMDNFIGHNEWWVNNLADVCMDQQDRDFLDVMTEKPGIKLTYYDVSQVFLARQRSGQSVVQSFKTLRKIYRMSGRWGVFVHRDHRAYASGRKLEAENTIDLAHRIMPNVTVWRLPLLWWRFGAVLIVRRSARNTVSS